MLFCSAIAGVLLVINHTNSGGYQSNSRGSNTLRASLILDAAVPTQADAESQPAATAEPKAAPLRSICDTPEFAADSPRLNVTIYVFAWKRVASLKRTLQSLQQAEYCGHTLPLHIIIDGGALPEVRRVAQEMEWRHGLKAVHYYSDDAPRGIRGMWIGAAPPDLADHQHVLPLEDDIEVWGLPAREPACEAAPLLTAVAWTAAASHRTDRACVGAGLRPVLLVAASRGACLRPVR